MVLLEDNVDTVGTLMQKELNRLGVKVEYGEKDKGKNTLYDMARAIKNITTGTVIELTNCSSFSIHDLVFGKDGGYISLRVIILMIIVLQVLLLGVKNILILLSNTLVKYQLLV